MNMQETSFDLFGTINNWIWRDEKTGSGLFMFETEQTLVFHAAISKRVAINNKEYCKLICDGSKCSMPAYKKKTPVCINGYFVMEGGKWKFIVASIKEDARDALASMEYLKTFDGITEKMAASIVNQHGPDVYNIFTDSEVYGRIPLETGIKPETVNNIVTEITNIIAERKFLEVVKGANIPYPVCKRFIKKNGKTSVQKIRQNPYLLEYEGLSFSDCDRLSKLFRYPYNYPERIRAVGRNALKSLENSGHIWSNANDFYKSAMNVINKGAYSFNGSFSVLVKDLVKDAGYRETGNGLILFNEQTLNAEKECAKHVMRLVRGAVSYSQEYKDTLIDYAESTCKMTYGTQQRTAFPVVLRSSGVKILLGGPGTGKTSTLKGVILAYKRMHPDKKIKLAAPTGRAAQRMAEATGMTTQTIHRLVEYRPYGNSSVSKDLNNPIDADLIIVDESSMIDVHLFMMLLSAIKDGSTLVLVGDVNQLESVGPGAVLHDLMQVPDSIIQKVYLTDIYRQAAGSPIIGNALKINNGEHNLVNNDVFRIINTCSPAETLREVYKWSQKGHIKSDPFYTQVLGTSRKGECSINIMNKELQSLLNKQNNGLEGITYGDCRFLLGDKIMLKRNNYDPECTYYNGDIGIITEYTDESVVTDTEGRKLMLSQSQFDDIELSYAMTIHKSQGSEFSNVIIPLSQSNKGMLNRNLLYTAVTRAKRTVVIINENGALDYAIDNKKAGQRRTMLSDYLKQYFGY